MAYGQWLMENFDSYESNAQINLAMSTIEYSRFVDESTEGMICMFEKVSIVSRITMGNLKSQKSLH